MISTFQAIILGALQGISELFPISSLGHSIVLPGLFGWNFNHNADYFLTFLVATHLATAIVLFVFYRKDWIRIISGILRSLRDREIKEADPDAKLGWLLIVGTIPAGVLGLLFEEKIKLLFISPVLVSLFLILNGVLLLAAEFLRKKAPETGLSHDADKRIATLTWWQAIKVGLMQATALIPGLSRTGATIAGGLLAGLSHADALRFSFLLATPIIGAAALLKLPELFISGGAEAIGVIIIGSLASAIGAYFAIKFLTKYFKHNTLNPFAFYCIAIGIISFLILH